MARRCSICARPDAGTINALLADGRSVRSVALELRLSEDALGRHTQRHTTGPRSRKLVESEPTAATPAVTADPLDELVDALRQQALAGNPAIVHQYRLALTAQADAKHAAPPLRELATEPEWIALRDRLLAALEPFPEARIAVAEAIK